MRDLVVREGLVAMARDAAKCLHGLVAEGAEIPYEVHEPGDGSPLCRYQPLTERFVRDHAAELRNLDSFGAACAALEAAGLAGTYLEQMGIGVPADARQRAELAGLAFLCRLWMDTSDFALDDDRLDAAIAELQAGADADDGQIDVIVPLRGLQMPVARLDLATATIVRADTVEVPPEARASDGLGSSPWEPAFLAVVRVDEQATEGSDAGLEAVEAFRRLVTTLRLFKAGGVGLGPHAWTRTSGDRWRRIATGAGRPRPGGYRLTEAELGDLTAFSRALVVPGTPFSRKLAERPGFAATLGRALNRFEAGLERNVVVEALNDHLLSLRFVLEGGGPANLGLPMRVAALCAEPDDRTEIKAIVDRAIGLERELWSGEPPSASANVTPADTAAMLEDLCRAILRDASIGHLGSDLRTTADEILLADGLAVGDGAGVQRGGTTEWDMEPVGEPEHEHEVEPQARPADRPLSEEIDAVAAELDGHPEQVSELDERMVDEPSPEPEEEMVIARAREIFGRQAIPEPETASLQLVSDPEVHEQPRLTDHTDAGREGPRFERPQDASPVLRLIEQTRAERRAHHDRVAGLFPPPEPTEWNVREIGYDRTRRARVHE
jgi:hypothetical protein